MAKIKIKRVASRKLGFEEPIPMRSSGLGVEQVIELYNRFSAEMRATQVGADAAQEGEQPRSDIAYFNY
jgi:hypothetical protein